MKIAMVFDAFPPQIVGGSVRAYSYCKYLAKFGHSVHLITKKVKEDHVPLSDFPTPKGCRVHRMPGKMFASFFPGSLYVPTFTLSAIARVLFDRAQIIHGSSPAIGNAVSGMLASYLTGKPFVMEMRDPWVRESSIVKSGLYNKAEVEPTGIMGRFFAWMEALCLNRAKAIVVSNPGIIDETLKVHPHLNRKKFNVVFNSADLDDFHGVKKSRNNKFTITYSGALYKTRAVDLLVEAMQFADGRLIITGAGSRQDIEMFKALIKEKGLTGKVEFLGVVPNKKYYSLLCSSDVLFSSLRIDPNNKFLLPSKLFNYMASGNAVLGVGMQGGDMDKVVREYKCGKMIYSDEPKEIAKALNWLKSHPAERKKMGSNGLAAVKKKFNREFQARELEKVYLRVLENCTNTK